MCRHIISIAAVYSLFLILPVLPALSPPLGFSGSSTLGSMIWRSTPTWTPPPPKPDQAVVNRFPDGSLHLERLGRPIDSMDPSTILISYLPADEASGLWAITHLHRRHCLEISAGPGCTGDDIAFARLLFFDEVVRPFSNLGADILRRLPTQDVDDETVLWSGYLANAGTLAFLIAIPLNLAWIGRIPGWYRGVRIARRLARGQCTFCGYSRAGLAPETPCPECGTRR